MWPGNRQLAPLIFLTVFLAAVFCPVYADSKRFSSQSNIQIVSIREDKSSNFVLLNTDRGKQLPVPSMRFFPGPNGKAIMSVDFASTIISMPAQSLNMPNSSIEQIHIGQFSTSPAVTRITLVAANRQLFKSVQFQSNSGSLSIKLPPGLDISQRYPQPAPDIVNSNRRAPLPVIKSTLAARAFPATPSAQINAVESVPQLRGPIVLENGVIKHIDRLPAVAPPRILAKGSLTIGDATYTRIADEKPLEPVVIRPNDKSRSKPRSEITPTTKSDIRPFASAAFKTIIEEENQPAAREVVASTSRQANGSLNIIVCGTDPITVRMTAATQLTYNAFRLHDPERLVIDIEGTDRSAATTAPPELPANPWIKSIRVGSPEGAPSTTRVVLDLSQDKTTVIEAADQKRTNLSFTLQSETSNQASTAIAPRHISGCRVVLDAGHGGSDPGAQRGDIQEKEITLQIVARLKRSLEARGVSISMTRGDDAYVSLEERVRLTNELQPDAFVSVHINSLETNNGIHGIETYFQTDKSKNLAQLIHTSLVKGLEAPDRSVRKARFYVINHTPVPAVLAEVGFISNKDERDKLISSDYQSQVAEALTDGVMLYLAECRQASAVPTKAMACGTIPAIVPSARAQSFTQNLHSQNRSKAVLNKPKASLARGLRLKNSLASAPSKLAHQQLKFRKRRLASLRS